MGIFKFFLNIIIPQVFKKKSKRSCQSKSAMTGNLSKRLAWSDCEYFRTIFS